jgi:hypothetical protein
MTDAHVLCDSPGALKAGSRPGSTAALLDSRRMPRGTSENRRLTTKIAAAVMLRDQLQIHSPDVARGVLNLQTYVGEDEVAVLEMQILDGRDEVPRLAVR